MATDTDADPAPIRRQTRENLAALTIGGEITVFKNENPQNATSLVVLDRNRRLETPPEEDRCRQTDFIIYIFPCPIFC